MRTFQRCFLGLWVTIVALTLSAQNASTTAPSAPHEVVGAALGKLAAIIEPVPGTSPQTFTATLKVAKAEGLPKEWVGQTLEVAYQAPDHFRLAAEVSGRAFVLGRDGQQLWVNAPKQKFGVVGAAGVPRFSTAPDQKDTTTLPPIKLPVPREQLILFPMLLQLEALPGETIDEVPCRAIRATPQPQTADAFKLPKGELKLWIRETDWLPARLAVADEHGFNLVLDLKNIKLGPAWPAEQWRLTPQGDAKVETVALSHLTRFIPAALSLVNLKIPTLGPATGERKLLASEGQGRLEEHDGTKVLFLKGSPADMGRQHGVLMKKQVKDLVTRLFYGVGVGSSFEKGRWFVSEMEEAQRRVMPYVNPRYLEEMDALARASGHQNEEIRLANFIPELFHCSGFAVYGSATVGGRLYHGRILDYMKGVGLEPNATVMVHQPDYGFPWVNISYAGFVGSVTAMNAKHIAIGEMGGRGEGHWDGKPMAQLVREVMEKSETLEQAVEIMRKGPRTCEYYYVISDGVRKRAVGIAATPTTFEVIEAGKSHPRLPHAVKDAVLMSAGDRYEALAQRVLSQHGKLDADGARHLMDRPVCMNSNIHSVLFAPETLDFWVANADSQNVASHTRYTHYNLADLLKREPPKPVATASVTAPGAN